MGSIYNDIDNPNNLYYRVVTGSGSNNNNKIPPTNQKKVKFEDSNSQMKENDDDNNNNNNLSTESNFNLYNFIDDNKILLVGGLIIFSLYYIYSDKKIEIPPTN